LSRLKFGRISRWPTGLAVYLGIVLVLCKSAGALIYGIVLGPLARWTTPRTQIHVAVLLAGIALLYPVLRLTFFFPTEELVAVSSTFSEERANSLKFRFDQEDALLSRASERLLFGWGRYGRNRVYWETGDEASVTDGLWIITLGQFGLVGFISQFGLLVLPIFYALGAIRRLSDPSERLLLATLAIIVAMTAVEQLPNSSISTWSWLLSGALLGRAEHVRKSAELHAAAPIKPSLFTRS
jgi:cell division protein FtsW (lipid II flippase)